MVTGVHSVQPSGDRVGNYVLRQFLAQGGMAELFLASPVDPARAHEVVVVKRVLPQFSQDLQFARMFAREASLASILRHPNIVEVFGDEGISETECFFAMEYVHGPDLNVVLKQLKQSTHPMPLEHALQIAIGMCAGLHHAHAKLGEDGSPLAIVHRDVSPSNVMISSEGEVKITDFGVAKALALTSFTQAGTRKGKLSYMSPEQAVADPVDQRTDIFAIGAVLFEMTTLQRMFGGENELAVMHKLLFRERPRPSSLRHDYPPELERIVMKAVAQKPEDRYATAEELQIALTDFAQRHRLTTTASALGRWIATVIPPTPHPASDPAFFMQDPATSGVAMTTNPGETGATIAHRYADSATVLDGSRSPLASSGQIGHASESTTPAPVAVESLAASRSYNAAPRRTSSSRPSSKGISGATIIAISLGMAVIILGGAFGYAAIRDERATDNGTESSAKAPAESSANPAATPSVVEPEPTAKTPAPISPTSDPSTPVDPTKDAGTVVDPISAQPSTPAQDDTNDQDNPRKTPRTGNGSRRGGKKKRPRAGDPKPETKPPETKPDAPSTPTHDAGANTPKKKKKDPLDQLFPTG